MEKIRDILKLFRTKRLKYFSQKKNPGCTTYGMWAKNSTYMCSERATNNRVTMACDLYCCLLLLYNLFAIKHAEKRERHVTKTHLVVERELLLVVQLHFQETTLVFRLFLVALHVPQPTTLDDALLTLQLLQGRHHLSAKQVGPVAQERKHNISDNTALGRTMYSVT